MTAQPRARGLSPERAALLRITLAMTVDERVAWLEQMIEIAIQSGALPKRVPDQERGRRIVPPPTAFPSIT